MKTPSLWSIAAAVGIMSFLTVHTRADGLDDIEDGTDDIEDIVDELDEEFDDHYEESRSYSQLESYLSRIESKSNYIHRLARKRTLSPQQAQRELDALDQLSHSLHDLVDEIERDAGRFLLRMFGDTRHVHTRLSALNNKIHNMQRAVSNIGESSSHQSGSRYSQSSSRSNNEEERQRNRYSYPTRSQSDLDRSSGDQHRHNSSSQSEPQREGGNIFQRIGRRHKKIHNAILGKD